MQYLIDVPEPSSSAQKSDEWYTPAQYIEAARRVMGGIDLDPASCELANQTVKAMRYYTKKDDGLSQEWHGRIWLNPPFGRKNAPESGFGGGKSIMGLFVKKLIDAYHDEQVEQAILLATPKTDTAWFRALWEFPICFATHRVIFSRPGKADQGHFYGTIFAYLGPHKQAFINEFSAFGTIAKRVSTPRTKPSPLSLWEGMG